MKNYELGSKNWMRAQFIKERPRLRKQIVGWELRPHPTGCRYAAIMPSGEVVTLTDGIDKQLVGEVCAKLKRFYPPEPYKGKGIHIEGQHVRRKEGKTVA